MSLALEMKPRKGKKKLSKEAEKFNQDLRLKYKRVFNHKMPDLKETREPSEVLADMLAQAEGPWSKLVTLLTLDPPQKRRQKGARANAR